MPTMGESFATFMPMEHPHSSFASTYMCGTYRWALQRSWAEAPCTATPGCASTWKKGHLCLIYTEELHWLHWLLVRGTGDPRENLHLRNHLCLSANSAIKCGGSGTEGLRCFLHSLPFVQLSSGSSEEQQLQL